MKPRYKKFLYLLVAATVVTSTAVADTPSLTTMM
jgi:hypothetical protein